MENRTAEELIYLARCGITGTIPDSSRISQMDLEAVYSLARRHMIASAAAMALEGAGVSDSRFSSAAAAAQRKAIIFERVLQDVRGELENSGIWYMLLKGAVLKDMYPRFGMREFADYDILIDASRAADAKEIMERLGFTTESFGGGVHDVYHRAPLLNFEIHSALFGPGHDSRLYEYYQNVEERLTGDGYEKHFTPEDFYLYFLAHEYKHYSSGGTGLRSLMDTFVFLSSCEPDMDYVSAEADKLGILEFEHQNRMLSMHLFGEGELTESDARMLDYILSSGTYGTITHRVQNKLIKNGWSKLRYMLDRFLVPVRKSNRNYDSFSNRYPFFYRYKVFLPVLPFYRTFLSIRGGRFLPEARAIRRADTDPSESVTNAE
ncbi:MAG: nucleotidyltransferase family protein [Eubacteriaceae bacterium]|nr:nucleotidyltransferase family protein [Eubacteriaceae bacterium]